MHNNQPAMQICNKKNELNCVNTCEFIELNTIVQNKRSLELGAYQKMSCNIKLSAISLPMMMMNWPLFIQAGILFIRMKVEWRMRENQSRQESTNLMA